MIRLRRLHVLVAAVSVGAAAAYALAPGDIGPSIQEVADGRVLHPAGQLTQVGNFPTGGALTPDGRFYWAVSTGRGQNDIRIVDVSTQTVVQTVVVPGASGGIVMDPTRPVAYISGVADSPHTDQSHPSLPGAQGDVVEAFAYDATTGLAHFDHLVAVPPPAGSPVPQGVADVPGLEGPPQNFPPTNQTRLSWPDRLAVSPDGKTLLVPLNLADHAAIVSTATNTVTYVGVGHYPYGAAILPDGKTGLVSNETDGTVSVIDLVKGTKTADIRVGPQLSHPEAITVDPATNRAYVAMANTDHVAVIDTKRFCLIADLSLKRSEGLGVAPVALALDSANQRLYVAEEGGDDLAVLDVHPAMPQLIGRVPTAEFPTDAAVHGNTLVWLSAKGFGAGPDPNGPNPTDSRDSDNQINSFYYLPSSILGSVGVLTVPTPSELTTYTATADSQVVPVDGATAPAGTPLRPGGPIQHVFFVVRENRTYDQILGDVAKGDGDPSLELFGPSVTPNIHALVNRFPLLDHVYANSEA
ncbi:MAG: hypothetical protein JO079_13930, partial [Frankiaceae bacterium]|nr:hypothetical protein [Frankiaceae bacterium]